METGVRIFWLLTGLASVAIGAIGVVLPLLPTTPFLLISAFAFARSSSRLDRWLREHRYFGPLIDNWHRDGSIDRRSKRVAILALVMTLVITWWFGASLWLLACQVVVLSAVAVFILTRPVPTKAN